MAVFVQIDIRGYGCYFEFSGLHCQLLNQALSRNKITDEGKHS